jgi:hypothetical protein
VAAAAQASLQYQRPARRTRALWITRPQVGQLRSVSSRQVRFLILLLTPVIRFNLLARFQARVNRRICFRDMQVASDSEGSAMKLLIEILLAIFLHPVAFVLCLINILGRNDLTAMQKVVWIVVTFIWGIGPILYFVVGGGALW